MSEREETKMADDDDDDDDPEIVRKIDASRRDFVRKALVGSAFAAPVVMTFTVAGVAVDSAEADNYDANADNVEDKADQYS